MAPNWSEEQIREVKTDKSRKERGEERHCGLSWQGPRCLIGSRVEERGGRV